MTSPTAQDSDAGFYFDPWTHGLEPEAVDRLILATARADVLAAHVAARLADIDVTLADADDRRVPAALQTELHALGLCAVHIRHLLADVTRLAGAYV